MKTFRNFTILLAFFSLVGCASSYQPNGLGGGYTDMALNKDTYYVTFRGNGFTSSDEVQSYVLRRSSELTLSKGYKYFVIISGGTNVSTHVVQTPATIHTQSFGNFQGNGFGNTSYYGNSAFSNYNFSGYSNSNSSTTINSGSEYEIKRYRSGATIKMLHTNKGYPQAYDAAVILNNYPK
jgi:hypothetical protein